MNEILRQAMAMQEQLLAAQQSAREREVVGSAGGGLVRVTLSGAGEPTNVHIDPGAVDPDDPEILEDLVLVALRDALRALQELQASAVGGLDLSRLGLGDLGGLGGLGGPASATAGEVPGVIDADATAAPPGSGDAGSGTDPDPEEPKGGRR
jgi:DNA-binding YbaB/EbfC family protein